jgi:hypothetical protein
MASADPEKFFYILKEITCYKCKRHLINTHSGIYFKNKNDNFVFNEEFNKKHRILHKLGAQRSCSCCFKFEEVVNFYVKIDYNFNLESQGPYFFHGPFGLFGLIEINKKINSRKELDDEFEKFKKSIIKYNRLFFKRYLNLEYQNKISNLINKIYEQDYLFGSEMKIRLEQQEKFVNYLINSLNNQFNKNIFYADKDHKIVNKIVHNFVDDSEEDHQKIAPDYIKYNLVNIINNNFKQYITIEFPGKMGVYDCNMIKIPYLLIRIKMNDDKNNWRLEFSRSVNMKTDKNNLEIQHIFSKKEAEILIQGLIWALSIYPMN